MPGSMPRPSRSYRNAPRSCSHRRRHPDGSISVKREQVGQGHLRPAREHQLELVQRGQLRACADGRAPVQHIENSLTDLALSPAEAVAIECIGPLDALKIFLTARATMRTMAASSQ